MTFFQCNVSFHGYSAAGKIRQVRDTDVKKKLMRDEMIVEAVMRFES